MKIIFEMSPPLNLEYLLHFLGGVLIALVFTVFLYKFKSKLVGFKNVEFVFPLISPILFFSLLIYYVPNWIVYNINYNKYIEGDYFFYDGYVEKYKSIGSRAFFEIEGHRFVTGLKEKHCLSGKHLSSYMNEKSKFKFYFVSLNEAKKNLDYRGVCIVKLVNY